MLSSAARILTPAPKAKKRPSKTKRSSSPAEREILLFGDPKTTRAVKRALGKLDTIVRQLASVEEIREELSQATRAVVLVAPLPDIEAVGAVKKLEDGARSAEAPVFVVVPEVYPDRRARKLYEAGVAAVFEWPYEALLLPAMLTDLAGAMPKGGTKAKDAALRRAVKARLALSDVAGDRLEAKVVAGTAVLSGCVDSYWKKQRVEGVLSHVPGVTAVVAEDVEVEPPTRPDRTIARDVRNALRSVARADPRTISISVQDGAIALAGTVTTHADLERAVQVTSNIEGVRHIRSLLTVSPEDTRRSRRLAEQLRKSLETLWSEAAVQVSVFGHIAVVGGNAPTLADKRKIEAFVRGVPGIGRVVNKMQVVG